MSEKETGSLLTNTAIALFAGALGSVLTLAVTRYYSVVDLPDQPSGVSDVAAVPRPVADSIKPGLMTDSTGQVNLQELQQALIDSAAERSQLTESLIQITRRVDAAETTLASLDTLNEPGRLNDAVNAEFMQTSEADAATGVRNGYRFNSPFNAQQRVENLVAAGVDEQTARDLQARKDQYQLARLELFDQASREGWSESDQLNNRLEELDTGRVDLREELGDDAYDRYLFESGISNRVGVASIIAGSAADVSGLQTGDVILSYAGSRVYQVRELQEATRSGIKGEYVQLTFDRGGQALSADIPRGPLGVTLDTTRTAP